MTKDQAEAILLAEEVLQGVGAYGPDSIPGTAWNAYVKEAAAVVADDEYLRHLCDGLHLLTD